MSTTEVKDHASDLAERRAAGETIGRKRKTRVTKRKVTEGDSSDEGDKENAGPSKRAKKAGGAKAAQNPGKKVKKSSAVAAQMPPRSTSMVIDSSDEDVAPA